MDKDDFLRVIAETAYNVGFGAKKHFSTYEIVDFFPNLIGFISITFGIYSLAFDGLPTDFLSSTFVVLGVLGLYIAFYNHDKENYLTRAVELTRIFDDLKKLYFTVKSEDPIDYAAHIQTFDALREKYSAASISKQILFSGWFAHYKFFWEQQIKWIDEQKHFSFWRDKVPLSMMICIFIVGIASAIYFIDFISVACAVISQG
ncbi:MULTISPECIES: SLATT domain-containing protein [unclassified Endozoicomonas]|uniref:SLATT domain-containing protein n=1 Tax=unclassified Endozoicomonas TaxID=2644528 RepID=UPI003BB7665A